MCDSQDAINSNEEVIVDYMQSVSTNATKNDRNIQEKAKKMICNICNKTFDSLSNARVHEKIHSGEKPFSCDKCQKCFTSSSNLKTHVIGTHMKEKPYECAICKKTFRTLFIFKNHEKLHTAQ